MATSYTNRLGTSPEEGVKAPVTVATSSNITLSGTQTIDSVAVVANDRVLVRAQTDNTENGIYVVSAGAWTRATDFNAADDVINGQLIVDASNARIYQVSVTGTWTPGTTAITFSSTNINTISVETGTGSELVAGVWTLSLTYTLGVNNLYVFVNGVWQDVGVDFSETSTNSITFLGNNLPQTNDNLTAISNLATTSTVTDAASVQYLSAGAGAVTTNVQTKIRRYEATPQDFGAVADGVTNDSAAFAAAITANKSGLIKGIFVPDGTYILNGISGSDSYANGLLLDGAPSDASGSTGRVSIRFESPGVVLKAGSNNMYLIRVASTFNKITGWPTLDANSKTGVRHLGIVPADTTQTSTVVHQNFNYIEIGSINGGDEGVHLKTGPDVGGTDSGCFYNEVHVLRINNTVRSCFLESGPNASSAPNNRNTFFIGQAGDGNANTGIHIESGDTNKFYYTNMETITSGTSPNATPTAIKVENTDSWSNSNQQNRFIGCAIESCTRDLDIANRLTELYGVSYEISKCNFTARPSFLLGGDWSTAIQYMGPLAYTDAAGEAVPNGVVTVMNDPASGGIRFQNSTQQLADNGHQWQTFTQYRWASTVVTGLTGTYTVGETVTGGTSSATGVVDTWDAARSMLTMRSISGTFQAAETLTGGTSSATSTSGTINTNNIESITNAVQSKYYQSGGEVHFHFRLDFRATASAEVKIKLPAVPSDIYIDDALGSVFTFPATIDGGGGALGSGPVVFADKSSRVNSTSNPFGYGVGYLRVLQLSGDAWDLAAANNKIYINVRYKITGL